MLSSAHPFAFISYANKDKTFVHTEITLLKKRRLNVWFDEDLKPGERWDHDIEKLIRACTLFVVFLTEDSVASAHVRDEIRQAFEARKEVVAIYWDDVTLPFKLHRSIRKRQTIDRHSMDVITFREQLSNTLYEHLGTVPDSGAGKDPTIVSPLHIVDPRSVLLAKVVFYGLLLVSMILFIMGGVACAEPVIGPSSTINLPTWSIVAAGGFLIALGLVCDLAAGVVFFLCLRKKK